MEKTTLSQKVDVDLAEKFKELQTAAGGTGQDFIETLIATYTQAQVDTDTSSPVYKEQTKVAQAFAQSQRTVNAFLEIASADKIAALKHAKDAVEAAQNKVVELENQIKEGTEQFKIIQNEKENLKKQVVGLEEKAESLAVVKQGFEDQRKAWDDQRNVLEIKVTELTGKLADVSDENIAFRNNFDVLKEDLQKNKTEYETAKTDHRLAMKDLEIDCQNKIHGLEANLNKDCEARIKVTIDGERESADIRVSEIQEQLTLARQAIEQLRADYEERIKVAVESERKTADDRFNKIMVMFTPVIAEKPEEKASTPKKEGKSTE